MSERRTFGQAVREARLAKGLSMGQLAASVERSTASVRRWERDEGLPTAPVVQDLVNVLDLDSREVEGLMSAQPAVAAGSEAASDATRATVGPPTNSAAPPIVASAETTNWFRQIRDPDRPWLGYIRAALTAVVLIVLAWALIWAVGEFVDAFGDVWESLWVDES